jgi:hypothetical protein
MEQGNLNAIRQFFSPDSQSLVVEIFQQKKENQHLDFLLKSLLAGREQHRKIFEYGLRHIPKDFPERGDKDIALYFFLVSELASLDKEARSFAVDASEYAAGRYEDSPWYRAFNPQKQYEEKIKPLLD